MAATYSSNLRVKLAVLRLLVPVPELWRTFERLSSIAWNDGTARRESGQSRLVYTAWWKLGLTISESIARR
jgi:hypothetical protein